MSIVAKRLPTCVTPAHNMRPRESQLTLPRGGPLVALATNARPAARALGFDPNGEGELAGGDLSDPQTVTQAVPDFCQQAGMTRNGDKRDTLVTWPLVQFN